jgi:hypothetical protein
MRKLNIHFINLPPVRLKVTYAKEAVQAAAEEQPRRIAIPVQYK